MSVRAPKYRLHKGSGQALVQINGRRVYLGKFGSHESKERYRQLVADWLRNGNQVVHQPDIGHLTIIELISSYFKFAKSYYMKDGTPTDELHGLRAAFRPIKSLYGHSSVHEFRPSHLKNVRQAMIELGHSRKYINDNVNRIRRTFRWGVENELVSPSVYQALQAVGGLKRGRSEAKESRPVRPVDDATVAATLPQLSDVVGSMVQFQQLTGCRPGEARTLRPCDIDRKGDVWVYRPQSHKTEHHGRERRIFIGPKAQDILRRWLDRDPNSYCFSPREAVRCDQRRSAARRTQRDKARRPRPSRRGKHYTKDSYNRVIARACDRAGIERWSPNQLRHSRATELRSLYGLEAAQTVLGHSQADVTQVYAERDFSLALRIMSEIG